MAMSFFNAFDLPLTIARPFNTYGPRQSARAIIPSVIIQAASGKKTIELGDLTPTRDFNYVGDVCRALHELSACDEAVGEAVNIGANFEISIGDTVKKILEIMNSDVELVQTDERRRPAKSEVFRLWCENSRLKELIGYEPENDIDEGLQKTIAWIMQPDKLPRNKADLYNV
jgi:nucleoside-diphosphate-sugar epimerase